jgi:hypothetical protein
VNAVAAVGLLTVLVLMRSTVATATDDGASGQTRGVAGPPVVWTSSATRMAAAPRSLIVRFADGVTARRTEEGLRLSGVGDEALRNLRELLARHQIVDIEPLFKRPPKDLAAERARAEQLTGKPQPDLSLFFRVIPGVDEEPESMVDALTALEAVETTYVAPEPAPEPSPSPGGGLE